MKISLCMIVKNEEGFLQQSLNKVSRYVDEIVVVDTGSSDRTKEIAQKFTEKIFDYHWCNDFSAARNFSLEKAANDWILVLDADEIIVDFNVKYVQNVIKSEYPVVGRINIVNIVADSTGERRSNERISRLFNRKLFYYEGVIHEQIVRRNGNSFKTVLVDITAEHWGYTQEVIQRTDKIARNITLLEQALEGSPEDVYLLYQIGKSYYMAKNYSEAVVYFKRALACPLNFSLEYIESLVETYGYALINSECYSEALCLENYEIYYAGSTDYRFLMGLVAMNNGRFSQAIEQFLQCIGNKKGKVEGINDCLPKYNIAVIYECLGRRAEAINYYKKCGSYSPALKRLREI